jgi:hypothetical protein
VASPKNRDATRKPMLILLVRGVLLLWGIELDFNVFLFFSDVKYVAEGLEALGNHLDLNFPLRNRRNLGFAGLVRAQFKGSMNGFSELDDGMALYKFDDHRSPIDRLPVLCRDGDVDTRHRRGEYGECAEHQRQC